MLEHLIVSLLDCMNHSFSKPYHSLTLNSSKWLIWLLNLKHFVASIEKMFPLYGIGLYNVVKTIQYNRNRIQQITLHNII